MMQIRDHGKWTLYKPDNPPAAAPLNALFARRESDGQDWYDYVNPGTNFAKDSVKMIVHQQGDDWVVGAAVVDDPTMLWPGNNAMVVEVLDPPPEDPQKFYGNKIYTNKQFRDRPPPEQPPNPFEELEARIDAKFEAILARLDERK